MGGPIQVDDYFLSHHNDGTISINGKGLESKRDQHLVVLESIKGGLLFATSSHLSPFWSKAPFRGRAIYLTNHHRDLFNVADYLKLPDWNDLTNTALKDAILKRLTAMAREQGTITRTTKVIIEPTIKMTDFTLRNKLLSALTDNSPWHLGDDIRNASGTELKRLADSMGVKYK